MGRAQAPTLGAWVPPPSRQSPGGAAAIPVALSSLPAGSTGPAWNFAVTLAFSVFTAMPAILAVYARRPIPPRPPPHRQQASGGQGLIGLLAAAPPVPAQGLANSRCSTASCWTTSVLHPSSRVLSVLRSVAFDLAPQEREENLGEARGMVSCCPSHLKGLS